MGHVLPDAPTMAAYTLACLVLFVTPGPDMSVMLSQTIASGRRAGVAAVLGTSLGGVVHTLAAALGVSALIAASATAFGVLKIGGALYLAWLAIDTLRRGSSLSVRPGAVVTPGRSFRLALLVNLTNPKVVLFFVTFLPQFVSAGDPNPAGRLAFLGLFMIAFSLPLSLALILSAERMVATLKRRPRLMRGIDWLFAGIFGAFAVRILTAETR
jgi:threonine/homoserine/homoserine lactone efflux protein